MPSEAEARGPLCGLVVVRGGRKVRAGLQSETLWPTRLRQGQLSSRTKSWRHSRESPPICRVLAAHSSGRAICYGGRRGVASLPHRIRKRRAENDRYKVRRLPLP